MECTFLIFPLQNVYVPIIKRNGYYLIMRMENNKNKTKKVKENDKCLQGQECYINMW